MAMVIPSEEDGYFPSSLRRSSSQRSFAVGRSGFRASASTSRLADLYTPPSRLFVDSETSSAPSSPQATNAESVDLSCSSTPASNFSLGSDCEATPPEIGLPQYDDGGYFGRQGNVAPVPTPEESSSGNGSSNSQDDSAATSRPGTPDVPDRAEDDIAIREQPSRHVDYLSHNWREEDIWSSWKLIVARRGDYNNSARLENASWRTWMKSKNNLGTVSAETLNWLKDCDVTWLYGPLQTGTSTLHNTSTNSTSAKLSKSNSFVEKKKPILKKRSMSEIMLQRSLSTSSLVKQAAAAVQAQQQKGCLKRSGRRPGFDRANTDYITFPFSSRGLSHDGTSLFPSAKSSGITSPSGERKHIHFNEQVSQCIAVEAKIEEEEEEEEDDAYVDRYHYDSDSDDGAIMMKRTRHRKRPAPKKTRSRNKAAESKTIAMLPSTTLKYREDTPEPESAMKHSTNSGFRSPILSPSSSQETLRPAKKSGKLFFSGDDEDSDDDMDDDNNNPRGGGGGGGMYSSLSGGLSRSLSSTSLSGEPAGMRRTASGMFMPLDETGDHTSSVPSDGLIGRIIDTVNTARDIAHVIWNVGWRN